MRSPRWCARCGMRPPGRRTPENRIELAALLADTASVATPAPVIMRALSGEIVIARRRRGRGQSRTFIVFHRHGANFPWQSHALWFYSQMVRWGQTEHSPERARIAAAVYRPDIYRAALAATGADFPLADRKVEGAMAAATAVPSRHGEMTFGTRSLLRRPALRSRPISKAISRQMPIRAWPPK